MNWKAGDAAVRPGLLMGEPLLLTLGRLPANPVIPLRDSTRTGMFKKRPGAALHSTAPTLPAGQSPVVEGFAWACVPAKQVCQL